MPRPADPLRPPQAPATGVLAPPARRTFLSALPRERLWMRLAAAGIDLLLMSGVPLLISTALVYGAVLVSSEPPRGLAWVFRVAQGVFLVLFLLRDAGNRSPGKAMLGLKVVGGDGESPGVLLSALRNAPLLVPGWNLWELLAIVRREDARRPGDRLAGTHVLET